RVHAHRQVAEGDPAGRDPAIRERPARRHEPRRPTADPPGLLRRARARAARLLAAPHGAPGAHRARTGSARLRDVDGGEARARSRVDPRTRPASVPVTRVRDRLARAEAVAARARIARRLIAVALLVVAAGV